MKKDAVIFRKDRKSGEIYAIFPYILCDFEGNVTVYQHIGQHSAGDLQHCIRTSSLAKEEEYKDLKSELESIGYKLDVRKRLQYGKYLEALLALRSSRQLNPTT
jgi:hypothetical protein